VVKERGLTDTDLATMLVPPRLTGNARTAAIKKKRVTVTRFRIGRVEGGKRTKPQGTIEAIDIFCRQLDIDSFVYVASNPTEAAALAIARRRPVDLLRRAARATDHGGALVTDHPDGVSRGRDSNVEAERSVRSIVEAAGVRYVAEDQHPDDQSLAVASGQHAGEAAPEDGLAGGGQQHSRARPQRHRR
jgi:hypothetical protein